MQVLQVSAELFPFVKTGGLADVAAALPQALQAAGAAPRLLLPGYPVLRAALQAGAVVAPLALPWGEGRAVLLRGHLPGLERLPVYLLDAPGLYDRPGGPYGDAAGQPHADNHRRFGLLGWAAARLAEGVDPGWLPQLVHAHDWHAGMACAYLAASRAQHRAHARSVFTVHNLAYQGLFDATCFAELGLPAPYFGMDGVEFHGQLSFMKAGLYFADALTTVSPTYAREIQTSERGCGLEGLLRARAGVLTGILHGVDETVWSPAHDPHLDACYSADDLAGKAACKQALQQALGLAPDAQAPLFTVVSRFGAAEGLDLVLQGLPDLLAAGGQLAVLGQGDAALATRLREAAARHPRRVGVHQSLEEAWAHRVLAASDVALVPHRQEPCGLTPLCAMAYGALPLVHRTGGLADTVTDCSLEDLASGEASGFVFEPFELDAYRRALRRALALWQQPALWRSVQQRVMRRRHPWRAAAEAYLRIYTQRP